MGRLLMAEAWQIPRKRIPNPTARFLLCRMAWTAKDSDQWPAYFAGWDTLALALGYEEPESMAAQKAIARALAQLTEAGCITPDGFAKGGNRRYRLTF